MSLLIEWLAPFGRQHPRDPLRPFPTLRDDKHPSHARPRVVRVPCREHTHAHEVSRHRSLTRSTSSPISSNRSDERIRISPHTETTKPTREGEYVHEPRFFNQRPPPNTSSNGTNNANDVDPIRRRTRATKSTCYADNANDRDGLRHRTGSTSMSTYLHFEVPVFAPIHREDSSSQTRLLHFVG